jgi:hypothetical protein
VHIKAKSATETRNTGANIKCRINRYPERDGFNPRTGIKPEPANPTRESEARRKTEPLRLLRKPESFGESTRIERYTTPPITWRTYLQPCGSRRNTYTQ